MSSIQSNDKTLFDLVLDKGKPSPQLLGEALYVAELQKREPMIAALKGKGAKPPGVELTEAELNAYTGKFTEQGGDASVSFVVKEGQLQFTQPGFSSKLLALGEHRFKFVQQGVTVTFVRSENGAIDKATVPGRGGLTTFVRVKEESK